MRWKNPPLHVTFGLLGLAFTAALVVSAWLDARASVEAAFRTETEAVHDQIVQRMNAAQTVTTSLAILINSSFRVDRDQFRIFSEQILVRHPYFQSTAYVPLVTDAERADFEQQQRQGGFPSFAITQRDAGAYIVAARHERYLPVLYQEPFEPTTVAMIGFDLLSDAGYAPAIDRAIDTTTAVSAPVTTTGGQRDYWLFKAIYAGKTVPETIDERRRAVNGMIALRVNAHRLLPDAHSRSLAVSLRLHTPTGPLHAAHAPQADTGEGMGTLARTYTVDVHGQRLDLEFGRVLRWRDLDYTLASIALITGLLVSGLLMVAGYSVQLRAREQRQRHQEIQRQVREKTAELAMEKERAQVTLASIGDGVITADAQGHVDYLNPVAEQLTGWSVAEAQGRPLHEVFTVIDGADQSSDGAASAGTPALHRDSVLVDRHGQRIAVDHSTAPIRDREDRVVGAVVAFRDVSHERELAQEMSYQATHDALTGLYNRRAFEDRLREALADARHSGQPHALLYLDLDQFKIVNDAAGHVAGDELLRQLTALLTAELRRGDTVARLGGDEFGIVLHECGREQALHLAQRLRQAIQDFRFVWKDRTYGIGVSIGMVMVDGQAEGLSAILSAADAACYAAKDKGRNRVQLFQADDAELAQRRGEMQWVTRVTKALEEDRFVLYAQSIVPIAPGSTPAQYEILIRMLTETGEVVPPGAFLPAAERYLLMPHIDRWVVRAVLDRVAARDAAVSYTINLSGQSLNDDSFLAFVFEQFERTQVPPSRVCFEITETAAVANLSSARQFITALKQRGCRFSLDDFGAGWSSFAYLKTLPVDYLKIDGSFVKDMVNDPLDFAMVTSINQIGHAMGIRTVAEFAENPDILQRLAQIGVDYAQGYGIDRPRPLDDVLRAPLALVQNSRGR